MRFEHGVVRGEWFGRPIDPFGDPWYRFGRVISLVERHAPIATGVKWMDVGCQLGQFLKLLRATYEIDPTGIDNFDSSNVIEVCRKYFHIDVNEPGEVINDSWRYLCRNIDRVGFGITEKFPYISALEVLEHMIDTDAFLKECREHLEDNGLLIISTPNINSLRNRVQVPLGIYPAGLEYRTRVHHVRLYNVAALKSHFLEHRLEIIGLTGVNFVPARFVKHELIRKIDVHLSGVFPQLCGNIIAIARALP